MPAAVFLDEPHPCARIEFELGQFVRVDRVTNETGVSLESHFTGKTEHARALFDRLAAMIKQNGPVKILPEKTRIAFQVRMSFIAVQVRRDFLIGHFVFARRVEHPRFLRVETFSPRNHLHSFRVESLADLDAEFAAWVREAYAVGEQKHLRNRACKS